MAKTIPNAEEVIAALKLLDGVTTSIRDALHAAFMLIELELDALRLKELRIRAMDLLATMEHG